VYSVARTATARLSSFGCRGVLEDLRLNSVAHVLGRQSHEVYSIGCAGKPRVWRPGMAFDLIDTVWSAMRDGELYSLNDLTNTLERSTEAVTRVLEFLTKYGFVERVTSREMIFRKLPNDVSPGDALEVLRSIVQVEDVNDAEGITNLPKIYRRFNPA